MSEPQFRGKGVAIVASSRTIFHAALPRCSAASNNTNMSFDDRLKQAIERGQRRSADSAREARAKQLTEEEFRRLHSQHRLALSDYIEDCVRRLPNHFPGFQYETM